MFALKMDSLASVPGLLSRITGYAANVPGTLGQVPVQFRVASTASNATYPFSNNCQCEAFICSSNECMSSGSCDERVVESNLSNCLESDLVNTNACSIDVILTSIFRAMRNYAFANGDLPGTMYLTVPNLVTFKTTLECDATANRTFTGYTFSMDSLDIIAYIYDARNTLRVSVELSDADVVIVNNNEGINNFDT
jgi:hypothetical protein